VAGPAWLADTLAAILITVSVYCAGRLAASPLWRRATDRDADIAHTAMGAAMAGMLVPRLNPLWNSVWEVVFGAFTAWFAWRVLRGARGERAGGWATGHYTPHLFHSIAMLYMLLAVQASAASRPGPGTGGMSGSAGPMVRFPVLALVLALLLLGYAVLDADRLTAPAAGGRFIAAPASPRDGIGAAAGPASPAAASEQSAGPADPGTPGPEDPGPAAPADRPALAPRLAACCRIVIGIAMGYMLIIVL